MAKDGKEEDVKPTEDDFVFIPIEEATNPTKGTYFQRFENYWWVVEAGGKGLAFYNPKNRSGRRQRFVGAPQCNQNEHIAERVARSMPFHYTINLIPVVWVPIDIYEFADV